MFYSFLLSKLYLFLFSNLYFSHFFLPFPLLVQTLIVSSSTFHGKKEKKRRRKKRKRKEHSLSSLFFSVFFSPTFSFFLSIYLCLSHSPSLILPLSPLKREGEKNQRERERGKFEERNAFLGTKSTKVHDLNIHFISLLLSNTF